MKFGKRIREDMSPAFRKGSVDYKTLKRTIKSVQHSKVVIKHQKCQDHTNCKIMDAHQWSDYFFAMLNAEKEKVSKFYYNREAWCFLALERTRGALFGLTRWASAEKMLSPIGGAAPGAVLYAPSTGEREGRFLEAKVPANVLLREARDLMKFVDMSMQAFRKILKKLDKMIGGDLGRACFEEIIRTEIWIRGGRAHGILRMALAMAGHAESLRPALSLGPVTGGPLWANRTVYSVGSFDRPRGRSDGVHPSAMVTSCTGNSPYTQSLSPSTKSWVSVASSCFAPEINARTRAPLSFPPGQVDVFTKSKSVEATVEESRLYFLREFGAMVVVGVYTDAVHAVCHGGMAPVDSLEERCERVRPHADRVVAVDSNDPAHVWETLLGVSPGIAPAAAAGDGMNRRPTDCSLAKTGTASEGGCHSIAGHCVDINTDNSSNCAQAAHDVDSAVLSRRNELPVDNGNLSSSGGYSVNGRIDIETPSQYPTPFFGSHNCCFVACDEEEQEVQRTDIGRRAYSDMRTAMELGMPVFRLPSLTLAQGFVKYGKEDRSRWAQFR